MTPNPAANINSRLDLVASIVNYNSLSIDHYHKNTIDKAFLNGHYYCDKAPGLSFSALIPAYIYGRFKTVDPGDIYFRYLSALLCVAIPGALLSVLLFNLLLSVSGGKTQPIFIVLATLFGTILFSYSTVFFGHVPAAFMSLLLFVIAAKGDKISTGEMIAAGAVAGWMIVTEYTQIFAAVIIFIWIALSIRKKSSLLFSLPGLAAAAAILLIYNKLAFGNWFDLGYLHMASAKFSGLISTATDGFPIPKLNNLAALTFGPDRGLFLLSPFLLFAIPGAVIAVKNEKWRGAATAAIIIILAQIYYYSSVGFPLGGSSPGPRYLVPIIPYLSFLCAFVFTKECKIKKGVFFGLGIFSILFHFILTATEPQPPEEVVFPVLRYCLPLFREGVLRLGIFNNNISNSVQSMIIYCVLFLLLTFLLFKSIQKRTNQEKNEQFGFSATTAFSAIATFILCAGIFAVAGNIAEKKDNGAPHYFIAKVFLRNDLLEKAKTEFEKLPLSSPLASEARYNIGVILLNEQNLPDALKYFESAISINRNFYPAYFYTGLIKSIQGIDGEAFSYLDTFINSPDNSEGIITKKVSACLIMASIEEKNGNPEDAKKLRRQAAGYLRK